ncbi:MAG: penicillin-binding transpeptidase domain-containing protein [Lachnospiraceae bacterium]|nr:penicillin-binding transpeptidase domain-containing protein [Lachnospiraceae bacterium]
MQRKLILFFGGICVLFVFLIGRIVYIETTSGQKYEKIVLAQQEYSSRVIPYRRGNIEDSKGTALASSIDVYNVILDCKELNRYPELIDSTMEVLAQCFPEVDITDARARLTDKPDSQYEVLAKKVSYEEESAFETASDERNSDKVEDNEVAGIWAEKEYTRQYPYGSLAASIIGFSSSGNYGVTGLENQYNDKLNGVNGRSYGYVNEDSDVEKTVIEPENGKTIVTSIDANIQAIVETELQNWNNAHLLNDYTLEAKSTGSVNTACLVMNPNTGEILALASYPFFDLNNPRDLSAYYSEEELAAMTEEQKMDILNGLWQNYAVTHTFEPGSTFKTFTIATGLDTGTLTGNETYNCTGSLNINGDPIHCWKTAGHGVETVGTALRDSCNVALMGMAASIGARNFASYQSRFGFGQKTNIDLPGEPRTASLLYTEEQLEQYINLATNSFGQNFNTTMVQLASAFCSVINGGKLYQPHLATAIKDDSGNIVENIEPVVLKQTISEDTCDIMRQYLRSVVREGTGTASQVAGYSVMGKTGTAEKQPRSENNHVVSFIGAVPAEDPELVIYVAIDTPNVGSQDTCHGSGEITHNILTQILPYLNVPTMAEEKAAGVTLYDELAGVPITEATGEGPTPYPVVTAQGVMEQQQAAQIAQSQVTATAEDTGSQAPLEQ